jgi:hypothetical protein
VESDNNVVTVMDHSGVPIELDTAWMVQNKLVRFPILPGNKKLAIV